MHACTHRHVYSHTCKHTNTHTHTHACMHPHTPCTHTHMHTHTLTHTHTHTQSLPLTIILHAAAEREEFPGLYTWADLGSLRNWLKDNVHLLLTSYCRSASTVVLINTDTKTVRRLYPG